MPIVLVPLFYHNEIFSNPLNISRIKVPWLSVLYFSYFLVVQQNSHELSKVNMGVGTDVQLRDY